MLIIHNNNSTVRRLELLYFSLYGTIWYISYNNNTHSLKMVFDDQNIYLAGEKCLELPKKGRYLIIESKN